jgi:hypothetical protein
MMSNSTPPSLGQFAKNDVWEDAWSFDMDNSPSVDELKAYLKNDRELSFEIFFGSLFFGIRLEGSPGFILELARHCLRTMHSSTDIIFFIIALGKHPLIGGLCDGITYISVGAVNAWHSVGALTMPKPPQALMEIDTLWHQISSQLSEDIDHMKAVELAYSKPIEHWIGIPISDKKPPYTLHKEMFRKALKTSTQYGTKR